MLELDIPSHREFFNKYNKKTKPIVDRKMHRGETILNINPNQNN
jgi:hypothetical protein